MRLHRRPGDPAQTRSRMEAAGGQLKYRRLAWLDAVQVVVGLTRAGVAFKRQTALGTIEIEELLERRNTAHGAPLEERISEVATVVDHQTVPTQSTHSVAPNLDVLDVPEEISRARCQRHIGARAGAGERRCCRSTRDDHLIIEGVIRKPFDRDVKPGGHLVRLVRRVGRNSSSPLKCDWLDLPGKVNRAVDANESSS